MKRLILCLSVLLFCSWSLYGQAGWTQKANFPGAARYYAVGFSIGHYGFIGCGTDANNSYNDFYKWDQTTNNWTKMVNYPGAGYEYSPVAFSIEGKGYVGLGWGGTGENDFWRFDTITNNWTRMASFPGSGRDDANWFVIGHKAYIISGSTGGPPYIGDLWVYDAHQNTWKQLNNPPSGQVDAAAAWVIGNHGYYVGGWDGSFVHATGYKYDTASDTWTSIPNIPNYNPGVTGSSRTWVKGSKAYVFNGYNSIIHTFTQGWVYDTVTKNWCEFTDMGKMERSETVAFVVNNRFYMGTGVDSLGSYHNDYWEFNPSSKFTVSDTISCNADTALFAATTTFVNPTWSWSFQGGNPAISNSQNPIIIYANPGTYKVTLVVSACGGNDTVTRTITIKSGGLPGITIKGKTPICAGTPDTLTASGGGTYLWSNGATTSSIIVLPNVSATYSVKVTKGCSKDTSIFVTVNSAPPVSISGNNNTICAGDSTILSATGGGTYNWSNGATTSSITVRPNNSITYTLAVTKNGCPKDTTAKINVTPLPSISLAGKENICAGDSTTLFASGGGTYKWSNGATTSALTVSPRNATVYFLTVHANGCSKDTSVLINVSTINASISKPVTICQGDSTTLYTSGGGTYKWSTGATTSSIEVKPASTTTYSVIVTNGACTKDTSVIITVQICSTSGVNELQGEGEKVKVYPNPNNGIFELVIASEAKQSLNTVEIYNVLGQQVYQTNINSGSTEINLRGQPQGIYLYRVITENGDLVGEGKIVKQ